MRLYNTVLRIENGVEINAIDISKDGGRTWEPWVQYATAPGWVEKFDSAINFLLSAGYDEFFEPVEITMTVECLQCNQEFRFTQHDAKEQSIDPLNYFCDACESEGIYVGGSWKSEQERWGNGQ